MSTIMIPTIETLKARKEIAARKVWAVENHKSALVITIRIELRELPHIGPICITECGDENMYFTMSDGFTGYCKCL